MVRMSPQELRKQLHGVCIISITPFKEDGSFDAAGYEKNLKYILNSGLNKTNATIVVGGSTGECGAMNVADRKEVLADFDAGKYNVLCNSMLLTEGWDCPSVDCVVVLRPTKVRSLYSQMVGRGTRLSPGKTDLLLLDFLWMTDKHELCRPADLVCEDRTVARQMTEHLAETGCPEDIEEAAAQASEDVVAQREEALAKQLEEQRRKKAKLVDPLQYEMSIQAEDLAGYVPAFGWEAGPPSEQQTAALEKLGILPDAVESAGKAALLLDRLNKRRDEGLTTPKQIRCLEKYGFQHVGTWSFEAARHMIDRIAAQGWRGVPKGVNPRTYTPAAEPPAADSPFDFGW